VSRVKGIMLCIAWPACEASPMSRAKANMVMIWSGSRLLLYKIPHTPKGGKGGWGHSLLVEGSVREVII
jgi:hypothetical protein